MGNSNVDWAAQSSLVEDQITQPLPEEQKRKVQAVCMAQSRRPDGTVDQKQFEEFLSMLGVHPTQADEPLPNGSPIPSPHLANWETSRTSGRIDRVDNLNVMQGRR